MRNQRIAPKPHWWQRKEIVISFVIGTLALIALILAAHTYHWDLTGLSSSQTTTITTEVSQSPQKKVTTTETAQPGKALWDWLQVLGVLAIPIVVAFGTAFITRQQAKVSQAKEENQQQEELMRTFFDKISELLLNKELSANPNIQSIIRARSLAALHILSTVRKAIVLRFLHDSDLLQYVKSFLYSFDLSNTDLNEVDLTRANLIGARLVGATMTGAALTGARLIFANLAGANLTGANLSEAILEYANLARANLSGANLSGADLTKASLSGANLSGADLTRASLSGANLSGANLNGAIISPKQVQQAKNFTPKQIKSLKLPDEEIAQIRKMAYEKFLQLKLPDTQAIRLADAVVASLITDPTSQEEP
jgi:uncharacterized protein YjbI with pentapeptide repeats